MKRQDILLALVPPICWGAGFTVAKPAIAHFPPLFMMLAVYGAIAVALVVSNREKIATPFLPLSLVAAFGITIQGALIFIALQDLSAVAASLIIQIQVPLAVMLGWMLSGDPFSLRKLAGTLVATVGVVLVVGLPEEKPDLNATLLMIAGAFFWALGQVLARRFGRDRGIVQLKGLAIAGVPQLLLATLLLENGQLEAVRSATLIDWAALVFVAVVGFYGAYATWYSLLRRYPVDTVAPFVLLMPVVSIITAALLLGERIAPTDLLGGAVIIAGLAIVSITPQARRAPQN
jgi:O-acetylserine/cysteine efflux transporter